jgi:hypothetical protein
MLKNKLDEEAQKIYMRNQMKKYENTKFLFEVEEDIYSTDYSGSYSDDKSKSYSNHTFHIIRIIFIQAKLILIIFQIISQKSNRMNFKISFENKL